MNAWYQFARAVATGAGLMVGAAAGVAIVVAAACAAEELASRYEVRRVGDVQRAG